MTKTEEDTVTVALADQTAGDELPGRDELEAIADPVERLRETSRVATAATEAAAPHRTARNAAALQFYYSLNEGNPGYGDATKVWGETIKVSRSLWNRIVADPKNQPAEHDTPEEARRIAVEAAEVTRRYDAVADTARDVMKKTARGLLNGEFGVPMRNAEVSAITGLSTARVAQLRTTY